MLTDNMLTNKMIYDPHVHGHPTSTDLDECVRDALDFLSFTSVEGINILVTKNAKMGFDSDALYLYLKVLYPDKFSVYDGLATGLKRIPTDAVSLVNQVKDMREVGFDGVKMWTNGSTKDSWGFELDDEVLDPMWSYLEETRFPLLIHVGTTEHWPEQRGPGSEIRRKPGPKPRNLASNEPDNERLYARMERVLEKHPALNIVLPHMYFMCEQKERLAAFMEAHPNVKLDICPGSAMYYYMSEDVAYWRGFFEKYQDRILFGTDNFLEKAGGLEQIIRIRRFLETGETFFAQFLPGNSWGFDVTGIGPLSDEILHKIYKTNFEKVRGEKRSVNIEKAAAFLEKELAQMDQLEQDGETVASESDKALAREVIARLKGMSKLQ